MEKQYLKIMNPTPKMENADWKRWDLVEIQGETPESWYLHVENENWPEVIEVPKIVKLELWYKIFK